MAASESAKPELTSQGIRRPVTARSLGVRGCFHWLGCIGLLFLVSELARTAPTYSFYHTPWLDVLVTFGALGMVWILLALALAGALGLTEVAARHNGWRVLGYTSHWTIWSLGLPVVLNLIRQLLAACGLTLSNVPVPAQLGVLLLIAAGAFLPLRGSACRWVQEGVRPLGLPCAAGAGTSLGLSAFVILGLLLRAPASPMVQVAAKGMPNVIIVVLDSLTSRDMSLYGYSLPTTPNLDALCRDWTVYENAHSAATGTLACLPILLTGRYPYTDRWPDYGDLMRRGDHWLSLAAELRQSGYETAYMADDWFYPSQYHLQSGFDAVVGAWAPPVLGTTLWSHMVPMALEEEYGWPGGGSRMARPGAKGEPILLHAEAYFRTRARLGKPFFATLHLSRPHDPYLADEYMGTFLPLAAGLTDARSQEQALGAALPRAYPPERQAVIDRLRLRYDSNVRKADAEVGELIRVLKETGLYDRSLVIVTADHGENFSGGYVTHYTPLLAAAEHCIPMLVKYPGQTQGQRVSGLVSNIDIAPTVFDAVGLDYPHDWCDGEPLRVAVTDSRRVVYVRLPHEPLNANEHTFAALSGDLKLVHRAGGLHLFDLRADPDERSDLIGTYDATGLRGALDAFERRMDHVRAKMAIASAPPLIETLQP